MKNILVLAPHADDEVVGCGGLIARRALEGAAVHVVVGAVGGLHHRHLETAATTECRKNELLAAAAILGVARTTILYEGLDMRLDTVPEVELVTSVDAILDETRYDEIYFPYASHNHDHRVLFNVAFAALRNTPGRPTPRVVALYEYAYVGWQPQEIRGGRMYVDISSTLERKLAAFEAYPSQLKAAPHPCSRHGIETLARMRGLEAGVAAAEMFYLQKLVE